MKGKDKFDPLAIVSKFAKQERELTGTTFIAPYVRGAKIRLRIEGLIYELEALNCPESWTIMQIIQPGKAQYIEKAPLSMVKSYLKLLPRVQMIVLDQFQETWWAVNANSGMQKIKLDGPVPIHLCEKIAPFETVYCRFDGQSFWFDTQDRRRDPVLAHQLRQALKQDIRPDELRLRGMLPQERLAYQLLYLRKHQADKPVEADPGTRISQALAHAGAQLDKFWYLDDGQTASVRFLVDGNIRVVQIDTRNLDVVSAGICLSGKDADFDLSSLVGVLREAETDYID